MQFRSNKKSSNSKKNSPPYCLNDKKKEEEAHKSPFPHESKKPYCPSAPSPSFPSLPTLPPLPACAPTKTGFTKIGTPCLPCCPFPSYFLFPLPAGELGFSNAFAGPDAKGLPILSCSLGAGNCCDEEAGRRIRSFCCCCWEVGGAGLKVGEARSVHDGEIRFPSEPNPPDLGLKSSESSCCCPPPAFSFPSVRLLPRLLEVRAEPCRRPLSKCHSKLADCFSGSLKHDKKSDRMVQQFPLLRGNPVVGDIRPFPGLVRRSSMGTPVGDTLTKQSCIERL